ncbi:MAG: hypothetical protein BWK76_26940 [Desulfobulbaceae bacterium A2]|nr:MAG: hypothetical protein BWK76_26940 [Desulfobulbaceae bacterium A2]
MSDMMSFFAPAGLLAACLPGYEPRSGQAEMAAAVAEALAAAGGEEQARCLLVEAGTGLGKTLAYLVPAVLSGRKVVVSTATRNLQEQILQRDIPWLQRHVDPQLDALCVKGRQNYLCLLRWQQLLADRLPGLAGDEPLERIAGWLVTSEFADRGELPWLSDSDPLWRTIRAEAQLCPGSDCPLAAPCHLNRLRRRAAAARLLVVNHHLLFSDLAVRQGGHAEVLPRYEVLILDEAHHAEQVAGSYFGVSFSRQQVLELCLDIERAATGMTPAVLSARGVAARTELFFALFPAERGRFGLADLLQHRPALASQSAGVQNDLEALAARLEEDQDVRGAEQLRRRALELADRLARLLPEDDDETCGSPEVRWYERRERSLLLSSTPLEVAPIFQDNLYGAVAACVLTSATLTVDGDFDYVRRNLGLPEDTATLVCPSPFDYVRQSLLYVPEDDFPPPGSPGHPPALHERLLELIRAAGGRSLLLFTSLGAMTAAHQALEGRLPYPLLLQGAASRASLLDEFRRDERSVLLGVASFWEGVDIPGPALSCVVIDKLPFEVPSDPVMMARMDKMRSEGAEPFQTYQVPRAILALRQGVGRLLRSSADRGVVAILDVRLCRKGYGRRFLRSLPPFPLTRDLDDVRTFFSEEASAAG